MNHNATHALEETLRSHHANIAGLVVRRRGETLYEYSGNGCTPATPVHVFSVTKSVISLLVGIAMGQGHIQSVHQKVLDFFPHYTPKRGEKTLQTITLEHLLTMTAPYKYRSAPYTKYFTSDDWVKSALDLLGGRGEAGVFRYTPLIGPDILSGILQSAAGRPVLSFAAQHLFSPLGIRVEKNITFQNKEDQFAFLKAKNLSGWVADPQGTNTAGWGLTLSARDMAQLGLLTLNGGTWQGNPLVPAGWLQESLQEHSRWQELGLPYGYLWWPRVGHGCAAMGDSGNVLYVNPAKELIVSIAALYKPTAKDRIELITNHIEPLFENKA